MMGDMKAAPALAQTGPAGTEITHATSGVFSQSDNSFRPTRDVSLAGKEVCGELGCR